VGVLAAGDFIREGELAGQPKRMAKATAVTPVTALVIDNKEMFRGLHQVQRRAANKHFSP
jgi:CRP-like cAMP-binding protein